MIDGLPELLVELGLDVIGLDHQREFRGIATASPNAAHASPTDAPLATSFASSRITPSPNRARPHAVDVPTMPPPFSHTTREA